MKKTIPVLLLFSILLPKIVFAQDDLLKMAMENSEAPKTKVAATFKTTKLINAHTNETVHKRTLDVRIGHRFGNMGAESNGGIHTFYGLDASTDIRIAFEYGITDRLMVGIARCKQLENIEGLVKFRALEQTTDNKIPLAITLFANAAITAQRDPEGIYPKTTDRMSYTFQAIIARKFSDRISFELLPTLVHRNYIFITDDKNDIMALGVGGRVRITKSFCVIADYFYNFGEVREIDNENGFFNPLGIGIELETGGHVFTIMFTNAAGIIENDYIPNTTDTWTKGGFKFSFNISRNFKL
ncbi:MAG: DUF5777 family beta-barrel protein [Bacteroidia bacterium]